MTKPILPLLSLILGCAFTGGLFSMPAPQAPAQPRATGNWKASGKNGAVAAGGQEAVDAGLEILKGGGSAADAAVAMMLAGEKGGHS
jgi:hypothetical protein